ncbi:recombinase family protein [Pirellulimonas nuda]|uniref:recombinase family protein n=1 Tax=Pirellulimonas nuda TaxID=2528009 RepID=UPI0011A409B0|nr:recombinase family protein [Pirellulimonas nuda]
MDSNAYHASRENQRRVVVYAAPVVTPSIFALEQVAACQKWACLNGLDVIGVFLDPGAPGPRRRRPMLERAIATAERSTASLTVLEVGVLGADLGRLVAIHDRLMRAGAGVAAVTGPTLPRPNGGGYDAVRSLAVLAEHFRDRNAAATSAAMAERRARRLPSGKVPYGYRLHAKQNTLVEWGPEQKVIRWLGWRTGCGFGPRWLADELNARGYRIAGRDWGEGTIRRVLRRAERDGLLTPGPTFLDAYDRLVESRLDGWPRRGFKRNCPLVVPRNLLPKRDRAGRESWPVIDAAGRSLVGDDRCFK